MELGDLIPYCIAVYAVWSEVVGLNKKWESNSVVEVIGVVLKNIPGILKKIAGKK